MLTSCAGNETPVVVNAPIMVPGPQDSNWQGQDGKILATLGKGSISDLSLKEVLPGIDANDARQGLLVIAKADAVAAIALQETGGVVRESTNRRYRQALVQSYLKRKLEKELTPATVPKHYVDVAYNRMRPFFDHFDAYYVMDFMLLCCRESVGYCAANAERFAGCFDTQKSKSKQVYDVVSEASPKTPEEFEGLFSSVQFAVGDNLKFQTYSMFYDKSRTWEEMTDMNRLTKPVTHQIIKMSPGEISAPVRDSFGWHVLYLKRFEAEEHRGLDDLGVRLEIGEKILSTVRQREYTQLIQHAGSKRKVQVHFERLNEIVASLNQTK
jgi:hypothetical protein